MVELERFQQTRAVKESDASVEVCVVLTRFNAADYAVVTVRTATTGNAVSK